LGGGEGGREGTYPLSTHGIQHTFSGDPLTGREVDDGAVGEGLDFLWEKEGGRVGGRVAVGKYGERRGKKRAGQKGGKRRTQGKETPKDDDKTRINKYSPTFSPKINLAP